MEQQPKSSNVLRHCCTQVAQVAHVLPTCMYAVSSDWLWQRFRRKRVRIILDAVTCGQNAAVD